MKRTLLFLFCALMSTQMFSETLFGHLFPTLAYLERTSCHYMEGNEQNRTLNRLSFEDNMFKIDGNEYIKYNGFCLREDEEGRILVYSHPAKKDLVLYDFTLEVGDTLTTLNIEPAAFPPCDPTAEYITYVVDYPIEYYDEIIPIDTLIVTDVSMVMMCDSNQYKKWTFSNGMEYMEYIGNLGADFFPIIRNPWEGVPTCCVEEHLVCASIYDRLVYLMDDEKRDLLNIDCPCTSWSNKWQWRTNTWNVLQFDGMAFEQTAQTWQYKLAHDTIIDGKEYTAVTRHWTEDEESTKEYVAAVRFAENQKAYIYYDNAEYLLYDFGYHEFGDTLEVFSGINNYEHFKTYKCVITDNYSTAGGIAEDTYVMDIIHPITGDTIPSALIWQEFVGSYSGFLHGGLLVPGNSNYQLLCAYKDNVLAYSVDNDAFTDNDTFIEYGCEYNAEQNPEDLFPTLWGLQRTGCTKTIGENENGTVWGSRSYLMQEIETATIDGKQYLLFGINDIYSYDDYCSLWLREENNKILVYSTAQKKDLVLYDFTLNVGDSLPRLYVDEELSSIVDYYKYEADWEYTKPLFVTEVSTITLLDGKEYKKWTFDNGIEYVEGIGSFGSNYGHNDFYQLIVNAPRFSDVYSQHLVCVSKNNKLLYKMDDAEMEQLETECLCEVETSYKSQWCNKWNVMWFDGMRFDETARTSKYRLGKDTVIGDYTYSKFISGTYVRFTDDRKVYVYHEYFDDHDPYSEDLPTGEYLAYDFSAQVGDTLEVFSGVGTYSTYPCVVDDVQIDSETNLRTMTLHKICRIDEDEYDDSKMTWIEGVGSPEGFLISYLPCGWAGGGTYALLCAYQGDELKYTGSLYERFGCDYKAGVVSNDLFPTLSGLQRTICREYCEQADNKTRIEQFTNLTTRTETGGPYLYYSPFLLREKDNKILIYSRTLNKDLVLYDFNLQVGDSLPMLYIDFFAEDDWIADRDMEIWCVVDYHKDLEGNILPADTLIVTDVSAITLLDGKEYKKWTFNNGMEYVEGIGSFGNGQWSGDFFQLIANKDVPTCLLDEHLVCASKNGQLLYQMDDTEMERLGAECLCEYNDGPKKDNAKDGKIGGRPTPTQWNMLEMVVREMENNKTILQAETFSYTLEDNSRILNNKTYFDLARQSTRDTAITKSVVGALHFSEDEGNRVYFLCDGMEYLLYDFTAEPGDSIEIFAGINNYPQATTYTHVVTSKDTLENGACRMVLEVVFPNQTDGTNLQKVWLAGLGSLDGIVHNSAQLASNARSSETQTSVMLCAWRDDDCLYTTDHPEFDNVGCVYNLSTPVLDIQTSETKHKKIIRDRHLYIIHNNEVYNVLGVNIAR